MNGAAVFVNVVYAWHVSVNGCDKVECFLCGVSCFVLAGEVVGVAS